MKILIVGCGYFGTRLAKSLLSMGHEVYGLRRDSVALQRLSALGIQGVCADITKPETLSALPECDVVVLCQAPGRHGDYKETYFHGAQNITRVLKNKKVSKILLISSTSVYSQNDGAWVDETAQPMAQAHAGKEDNDNAHFLLGAEKNILNSGIPSVVLRLGGIYGPKRHRLLALKEGKIQASWMGNFINRIHVDDAVKAALLLIEKGEPGNIYLGVDDEPSSQKDFYAWIYSQWHWPIPENAQSSQEFIHGSNKRCSNKKLKNLGMIFEYPNFRQGYSEILGEV